ncbi:MAPEG family protein [Qipengyuania sediminis]|uniref:MAPEG family protein n=1 Tax=Qipengyuania sediminis TaxID=1532023 RepID=UPI00197DAADD|nr:MAPEG family protein [Qipengyuania sediminis]
MIGADILQPVVALLAWTMVMWLWMYAGRIPAVNRHMADKTPGADVGWTGATLEAALPREVQWKAHNYNHLHEGPTLFYAVALVLAIAGNGDGLNATLGWIYVGLRIAHSIWQATVNRVMVRFALFALSTLVLTALIVHAAMAVF